MLVVSPGTTCLGRAVVEGVRWVHAILTCVQLDVERQNVLDRFKPDFVHFLVPK